MRRNLKLTIPDITQLVKNGVVIDGDQLVKMVDGGLKTTAADLVDFTKLGMGIWQDDLDYICKKLDITLTHEQLNEINPIGDNGKTLLENRDV